jgi:serine-threonine kinase receptor-associated protein
LNIIWYRKLWDSISGLEIHSFAHKHIVKSVDFSSDGTKLATGCNDKSLRIFDINNYDSPPLEMKGHTSNIKKALFSSNSRSMVSISDDKTLRVWDVANATEISQIKFTNTPTSIEISSDEQMLILTQGDCVELYDANTFEKMSSFKIPSLVSAASIHPDKSVFVCGSENFTLYKYDVKTGVELGKRYNTIQKRSQSN